MNTSSTDTDVSPPQKKVPSWWRGDEAAAQSSVQAAREHGFVVGAIQ